MRRGEGVGVVTDMRYVRGKAGSRVLLLWSEAAVTHWLCEGMMDGWGEGFDKILRAAEKCPLSVWVRASFPD